MSRPSNTTTIDQARRNIQQALQDIAKYKQWDNDQSLAQLERDRKSGRLSTLPYWLFKSAITFTGGPAQLGAGFLSSARQRAIAAAVKEHPELAKEVFTFSDPYGTKQLSATGEELAKNPDNALNTVSGAIDTALTFSGGKAVSLAAKAIAKQSAKEAIKQSIKQVAKQPGKTMAKAALPAAYVTGSVANLVSTPEEPDNSFSENIPSDSVPYVNPNLEEKTKPTSITSKLKSLTPSSYLRPVAGGLAGGGAGYLLSSLFTKNPWLRGISSLGGGLGGAYVSLDSKDRAALNKSIKDLFTSK